MELAREIETLVAAFTAEISALAKLEPRARDAKPSRAREQPAGKKLPGNGKRSSAQLAEFKQRILSRLASNPGIRTEELNAALGTSTKELALPLRQLVADSVVRTEGERRGTRYYAAGTAKKARRSITRRARERAMT